MKCAKCKYLSEKTLLKGKRNIIGICSHLNHYGKYRYDYSECPDKSGDYKYQNQKQ